MGLLDDFSGFIKTPEGQGLLSAVFGGLASAQRGAPLQNIGRAGMAGLTGYSNAQDQQIQMQQAEQMKQMREYQLNQLKQQQADEQATKQALSDAYQSPGAQAISLGSQGPTNENAALIPLFKPKLDVNSAVDNLMRSNPIIAMKIKKQMTPEPIKLGAEESLLDPNTYKPLATGMGKTPSVPSAIQEYNFAKGQGYGGTFQEYQLQQKPKTDITLNNKINSFMPASEAAQKDFMDKTSKNWETLKDAPVALKNIDQAKLLVSKAGGLVGSGAETKLEIVKFFNNNLGTNIAPESVKSAEELRSRLFFQIMENLKKMDAQPSQMQQKIMMESLGNLGTDPSAIPKILDAFGDAVKGKVSTHNATVKSAVSRGVKFPFDPIIDLSQPNVTNNNGVIDFSKLRK